MPLLTCCALPLCSTARCSTAPPPCRFHRRAAADLLRAAALLFGPVLEPEGCWDAGDPSRSLTTRCVTALDQFCKFDKVKEVGTRRRGEGVREGGEGTEWRRGGGCVDGTEDSEGGRGEGKRLPELGNCRKRLWHRCAHLHTRPPPHELTPTPSS